MAGWGQLEGAVVGVGVGSAAGIALEPILEPEKQAAWAKSQAKLLDVGALARLVAQGLIHVDVGIADALKQGYTEERFRAAVQLALTAPPVAEVLDLWRRGLLGPPTSAAAVSKVDHALAKAQIEPQFWAPIRELFGSRLDAPVIALAIVRGIMKDPGFLPVGPPSTEGKVQAFPVSPLDPIEEARATGIDKERLFIETAIAGRPMGPEAAAAAVFRGILDRVDYDRAIAEGDVRNEWADAIFTTARQIPTAHDFVEKHLRGWTDAKGMYDGTARHGMSEPDTETLFQISGRPPSWHQIWIGLQRGGIYDGPLTGIDPAFLKGLRESNIRPEWYHLLWHSRYTYPSAFVLRALVQDGTLSAAQGEADLLDMGWRPDRAQQAAAHWAGAGGATADPHVAKAQTQLWTTAHRSFIAGEIHADAATPALAAAGVAAGSIDDVLTLWRHERDLIRAQLTSAQIKKAYAKSAVNAATGESWTRDEALAALSERGWAPLAANDYLNLP